MFAYYQNGELFVYLSRALAKESYEKHLALNYDEYVEDSHGRYPLRVGKNISCQKRSKSDYKCILRIPVKPKEKDLDNAL